VRDDAAKSADQASGVGNRTMGVGGRHRRL